MVDEKAAVGDSAFERQVAMALNLFLDVKSVESAPSLPGTVQPDLIAHLGDGRVAIVEVRSVTPTTSVRLEQAAAQLKSYGDAYLKGPGRSGPAPELVLVVAGALAPERVARLRSLGIDNVIDGPRLKAAAPTLSWPDSVASKYRDTRDRPGEAVVTNAQRLIRELKQTDPGQQEWASYQSKVREILTDMLCPPLEHPLSEDPNMTGVNRRDILFPNYADGGFWKYLRDIYEAHFLVVEAKNTSALVIKNAVLQVANYLSTQGLGLFGVIACRRGASRGAEVTRREQWIMHRKLIIVLNDDDLRQMVSSASNGEDPGIVIRQKIEDFRRSI